MSSHKIVDAAPAPQGPRYATLPPEDVAEIHGVLAAYGRYYDDGEDAIEMQLQAFQDVPYVPLGALSQPIASKYFLGLDFGKRSDKVDLKGPRSRVGSVEFALKFAGEGQRHGVVEEIDTFGKVGAWCVAHSLTS